MKDENGIYIECQNCASADYCNDSLSCEQCPCQNGAFLPSKEAYEARIQELMTENALLKDGESHITDVKLSPKFVKSIIRAVNSEVENLKKELRFTDKELNLIHKYLQEQIWEYKDGWSAVKKIIAKCNELLKERKD